MMNDYVLLNKLNQILEPHKFSDYCPNGLQIEGVSDINKIITGVSLNQELIDYAIKAKSQAIIVHHGIFWNKDSYTITGIKKQRIEKLIKHGINLYAYHLPLDNHPTLGNNIQLARALGIQSAQMSSINSLVWHGEFTKVLTNKQLTNLIESKLSKSPYIVGDRKIKKIAWCTGGADSLFTSAIELGVDAYLSGEISEPIYHMAKESNITYIASGHHATECGGIMALTQHLKTKLKLDASFVNIANPL